MALRSDELDNRYTNLHHMMFECECGWTTDELVADLT